MTWFDEFPRRRVLAAPWALGLGLLIMFAAPATAQRVEPSPWEASRAPTDRPYNQLAALAPPNDPPEGTGPAAAVPVAPLGDSQAGSRIVVWGLGGAFAGLGLAGITIAACNSDCGYWPLVALPTGAVTGAILGVALAVGRNRMLAEPGRRASVPDSIAAQGDHGLGIGSYALLGAGAGALVGIGAALAEDGCPPVTTEPCASTEGLAMGGGFRGALVGSVVGVVVGLAVHEVRKRAR